MKKILFLSTVILLSAFNSQSQSLKFISYNLRYDNPNDGINRWELRKENIVDLIEKYDPDVFGTQEGLNHQVEYLNDHLSEYNYLGVGRDNGEEKGEYCAIFYKKDLYKVIDQSTFWLSKTPDKVSVGWDAVLERICTYTLLENKKTGKRFWVFNAHFDHVGKEAQQNSAQLIFDKIKEFNTGNYPCVLMGDLNLKPESKAIRFLSTVMDDTYDLAGEKKSGPAGTFNAFKHEQPVTDRIDYIFVSKNDGKLKTFKIVDDKVDGRYPSDHLPVFAVIKF